MASLYTINMEIKKAMIFAAGLGTRLKPFTNHHPKALAMVNGKSLLQRNVAYCLGFGIESIIVNVHHFAQQIIDEVQKNNGWGADISFSDETDELLETGGGMYHAKNFFESNEDFVVLNADILTNLPLQEMMNFHTINKPLATLAVSNRLSTRSFIFNDQNRLIGWQNSTTNERKIIDEQQPQLSLIHI
jgi:MurNAc alpha-1-phosphate uridylyltransferase